MCPSIVLTSAPERPQGRNRMSTRYKNPSAVDSVSALISRWPNVQNRAASVSARKIRSMSEL